MRDFLLPRKLKTALDAVNQFYGEEKKSMVNISIMRTATRNCIADPNARGERITTTRVLDTGDSYHLHY